MYIEGTISKKKPQANGKLGVPYPQAFNKNINLVALQT